MPARFRSVLAGFFLWLLLSALPAGARELLVVGAEFGRLYECTPAGDCAGLAVDLLREFARRRGDTLRFRSYPWPRAQAMVEAGQADILVGPYRTPEREFRFAFAARPFYRDHMVFYARRGDATGWNGDYASLAGRRVAAVGGWVYGRDFDVARRALAIPETSQLRNGILMLARGHIDLLATNLRNTETLLPALGLAGAVAPLPAEIELQDGYMAFPRQARWDALRASFDGVFAAMQASGEFAALARRYGVAIP